MRPRFLGRPGERIFTQQFLTRDEPVGHMIYLPPFGEEMNRCRALVADQARELSSIGYQCTLIDFFGTGDSEGELARASFDIWRQNIELTISTLVNECDIPVTLWGLRTGALIAMDFAVNVEVSVANILLWQPVTSGKRFVNQLLRQRVAALANSGQTAETTGQIMERLRQGECAEVSGYLVADPLITQIENSSMAALSPDCTRKIFWLENIAEEGDLLSTASQKVVDKWRGEGCDVEAHLFTGPPIWQLHKRDQAPELVALTSRLLA